MILPINHIENWRLIRQCKQAQIYKDVIRKNSTRIDHNYVIGDWFMVRENNYFNETPFKGCMKLFKPGQTETLPFKWEESKID